MGKGKLEEEGISLDRLGRGRRPCKKAIFHVLHRGVKGSGGLVDGLFVGVQGVAFFVRARGEGEFLTCYNERICVKGEETMKKMLMKNPVLSIGALLALATTMIVGLREATLLSIDWRTLFLLLGLLLVGEGLKSTGVMARLGEAALRIAPRKRPLAILLVALPFLVATVLTNDVALVLFVPFALSLAHCFSQQEVGRIVVFQTIAANLGAMATPMGSPQNLFLSS